MIGALAAVRDQCLKAEREVARDIEQVDEGYRASARNLMHYLGLRRQDLRPLQLQLAKLGLSSLGRAEAHTLAGVDAVLCAVYKLSGRDMTRSPDEVPPVDFDLGDELLVRHSEELLGLEPADRAARIMVTMPSEAASDPDLVSALVHSGMDVMRINCAHDDASAWSAMIANLREAEGATGRRCRVLMDLAGPKLRTGDIEVPGTPEGEAPHLLVCKGDRLLVVPASETGGPGRNGGPARVPCTLPEIFTSAREGQRILFDDGKIAGRITQVSRDAIGVSVTRARDRGTKLKADKGINLPDTDLALDPITDKDRADLRFVGAHADMIGYSFVSKAEDVIGLQREVVQVADGRRLGLVLKIETQAAFRNLPKLLLAGMRTRPLGVMVARGDLGVEVGFDRLAELQEEILWICEAAHVPVIWATQVLENMAKKGMPTRAEVTDAAMSGRAECVMLNKGRHVVRTVQFLAEVLKRMQGHVEKKRTLLRRLSVSELGVESTRV